MNGIDTMSDVDAIVALDFEPEMSCEAKEGCCGKPAAYVARCRRCGRTQMFCVGCRAKLERAAEFLKRTYRAVAGEYPPMWMKCAKCGFKVKSLDEAFEWFPVKGGR